MSVMHAPDSEYAKERVKWEAQNSILGHAPAERFDCLLTIDIRDQVGTANLR